ncbi:hypothetical protein [Succinimonas sp.]|uniref:hypothetical protein n=1 Tax=Succinimonas sp. TaxID=1936151 RepID=UPI0038678D8F
MKCKFGKSAALVFGALAFAAAGCGGGDHHRHHHDDHDGHDDYDDTVLVDLQVIDGYLDDAMVFIDMNRNFEWDRDEPRAYADDYGLVHLSVWKEDLRSRGDTPLQAIAVSRKGARDYIYDGRDETGSDIVMSRNIFVNRDMNDGVWYIISPFSTLTDIELNGTSAFNDFQEYRDRLTGIAGEAGASEKSVYDSVDYNVSFRDENDLKTVVAGEVLARKGKLPKSLDELEDLMKALSRGGDDYDLSECRKLTQTIVAQAESDMKDNNRYSGNDLIATIKDVIGKSETAADAKDNDEKTDGEKTDQNAGEKTDEADNTAGPVLVIDNRGND